MTEYEYVGTAGRYAGVRVAEDDREDFMLKECGLAVKDADAPVYQECMRDMVEWFFSGDWVMRCLRGANE